MALKRGEQFQLGLQAVERGYLSQPQLLSACQRWLADEDNSLLTAIETLDSFPGSGLANLRALFSRGEISAPTPLLDVSEPTQPHVSSEALDRLKEELIAPSRGSEATTAPTSDWMGQLGSGSAEEQKTQRFSSATIAALGGQVHAIHERNRFRIIGEHARGGLGIVFRALDQQLHRTVALKQMSHKIPAVGFHRDKFVLEAEVTGQLEHPGIVPVYALGTDASGRPFYAMKFISGDTLRVHISRLHAEARDGGSGMDGVLLRQILRRFIDVCNAIQYAHDRLVLHRDIKPQNIMLGDHGETLVVDWGLAKVVGDRETSNAETLVEKLQTTDSSAPTQFGAFVGTAAYASPEQLLGQTYEMGPHSDIYSLGATLYEILVGKAILQGAADSRESLAKLLSEGAVPAPHTLRRGIPKPLSAICMKAVSYTPQNRYPTAAALANDIERWMADESIVAYQGREPALERMGRLLRRHRSWTAPIGISLVFVTGFSALAGYWINQARLNEREAKSRAIALKDFAVDRQQSAGRAVDSFLLSTEELSDFEFTRDLQRRTLYMAQADYQRLASTASGEAELELERVRAARRLGDIFHLQQQYAQALEQYQRSLEMLDETEWDKLIASNPSRSIEDECLLERGKAFSRMGLALDLQDAPEQARERYAEAHELFRTLDRHGLAAAVWQGNLARSLSNLGSLELRQGNQALAIELFEESQVSFAKALPSHSAEFATPAAENCESLSRAHSLAGDWDRAERTLQAGLQILNDNSLAADYARDTAQLEARLQLHSAYALLARIHGRMSVALDNLVQAAAVYEILLDEWPDSLLYHERAATIATNRGLILLDMVAPAEAIGVFDQAKATFQSLHDRYPQRQQYRVQLATALSGSGQALTEVSTDSLPLAYNDFTKSIELSQALALEANARADQRSLLQFSELNAVTRSQYARLLHTHGEFSLAQEELAQAIDTQQAVVDGSQLAPESQSILAQMLWRMALLEFDQADTARAEQTWLAAKSTCEQLIGDYPSATYQHQLALLLLHAPDPAWRDYARAKELCTKCLAEAANHRTYQATLAWSLACDDQPAEAMQVLQTLQGEHEQLIARELLALAIAQQRAGDPTEARQNVEQAVRWMQEHCPMNLELRQQVAEVERSLL